MQLMADSACIAVHALPLVQLEFTPSPQSTRDRRSRLGQPLAEGGVNAGGAHAPVLDAEHFPSAGTSRAEARPFRTSCGKAEAESLRNVFMKRPW